MITFEQIVAETLDPLTDEQIQILELLVKQYGPYASAVARWPQFIPKLREEQTTPTVKTKALKAVITALSELPNIKVESQGNVNSPAYFSAKLNWDALAIDVLNTMYDMAAVIGQENYVVVQKEVQTQTVYDEVILPEYNTGKRW